jgi:hypothetical protein
MEKTGIALRFEKEERERRSLGCWGWGCTEITGRRQDKEGRDAHDRTKDT